MKSFLTLLECDVYPVTTMDNSIARSYKENERMKTKNAPKVLSAVRDSDELQGRGYGAR